VLVLAHQAAGALAAGVDQHTHRWCVGQRAVGAYDHPFGGGDRAAIAGKQGDAPTILGMVARPVREDFPRADGVELFDIVEQQDPDVLRRCSHALIKAGCRPGARVGRGSALRDGCCRLAVIGMLWA